MTLPLLSRPVLDDLGGVIGAEKLQRLLVRFTDSLRTAFPKDGNEPGAVAREAHTLISMSGMLGCERALERLPRPRDAGQGRRRPCAGAGRDPCAPRRDRARARGRRTDALRPHAAYSVS